MTEFNLADSAVKYGAMVPMSRELARDVGLIGDRDIPDGDIWRARWKAEQPFTYYPVGARMAPPWEYWDNNRPWPPTFDPFPRVTRLQAGYREARRRVRNAVLALKDDLPDEDY